MRAIRVKALRRLFRKANGRPAEIRKGPNGEVVNEFRRYKRMIQQFERRRDA